MGGSFEYRKGGGVRRNGDFISTAYIEKAILESGRVSYVFVYGIPAASGAAGEKDVVAAVMPAQGTQVEAQTLFHCRRAALEPNFVPSFIQVVPEIPKTASEKPLERLLAQALTDRPEEVHTERGVHSANSKGVP